MILIIIPIIAIITCYVCYVLNDRQHPSSKAHDCSSTCQSVQVPVGSPHGKDVPVQELRYFCVKDKGYHVSVWPKEQGIQGLDYIEFNIAGIKHGDNVDDHLGEFAATLEPEPTNPYDPNAIKILARNGDSVGYVPKDIISNVRAFTQLPCKCYCYIGINNEMYYSCCYISKDEC